MEQTSTAPPAAAPVPLRFTGMAGEYFRIWIVNVCLSVLTLGIYSAWAKVRRKRYFYGNTLLNDASFEYLGNPVAILKGRAIVFAIFGAYALLKEVHFLFAIALFAAIAAALPWVIQRALQFNARNSTHRNVRFGFKGTKTDIFGVLLIGGLLVPVTLGMAYPYYLAAKRRLFVDNSSYGDKQFGFSATTGDYYVAALKLFLAFIGFLIGSIITVGIGVLPLYLLLRGYAEVLFARLAWRSTMLDGIRFDCRWTAGGLFGLYFVNSLAVLFTLGLLVPWAAIRTARYKLERITLQADHGIGTFLPAAQENVGAVGDEAGELLGFDFGL
ncbi:MAG TPA: YjgN family protein [Burkholderiales bacterium]|jgi:uncharacterized membrane protein YjgN (DUF898 family)